MVMNSKISQHPVGERRLRPIYDLLDNGNNKKAIQEADKVLKKQPTLLCAKALKALALLRLGKENESLDLLEIIRKDKPTDDPTLQAMTLCYKDLNKFQVICELFDAAKTAEPNNEDVLINLFSAYVRVGDYKKQEITAFTLYKIRHKGQYYFWALMSILLQALSIDELLEYCTPSLCEFKRPETKAVKKRSDASNKTLCWAEKVVEKIMLQEQIEPISAVLLVVAEALENYDRALSILHNLKNNLPDNLFSKKEVDLLIKMGRWGKANLILKKLLMEEPDCWALIQYYLESVFQIVDNGCSPEKESDHTFKSANLFILNLITDNANIPKRGPFLAQLEFYKLLKIKNYSTSAIMKGDLEEMIISYIRLFGRLDCCSRDLVPYLPLLPKNEIKSFLNLIWMMVDLERGKYPADKFQMTDHLNNLELTRASGIHSNMSTEEKVILVSSLINYFVHAQEFSVNIPYTESRPSDRYMLLAVHVMYDLWIETMNCNYLFEAIIISRFGLKYSPSNKQLKLLLVKLYHLLGGSFPAHEAFKDLDVKHMQTDTLGYIHLWPTLSCGDFGHAGELLVSSLKFYANNFKDSADHVTFAYKFDAYNKIPEFINIKECLNNSLHYKLVKLENIFLQLLQSTTLTHMSLVLSDKENHLKVDNLDWKNLYDNRDFRVLWDMDGEQKCPKKEDVDQSLSHELTLLKLKLIMYKVIYLVITLDVSHVNQSASAEPATIIGKSDSSDETSGYESGTSDTSKSLQVYEIKKFISSLQDLSTELSEIVTIFKDQMPSEVPQTCITAAPVSRLLTMFQYKYFTLVQYEVNFLLGLLQTGEECDPEQLQTFLNCIYIYFMEYTKHISEMVEAANAIRRTNILNACTLYLEIVSFSSIIVRTLESIFHQSKPNSNKKTKKKKDVPSVTEDTENIWKEEMIKDFKQCISDSVTKVQSMLDKEEQLWVDKDKTIKLGTLTSITTDNEENMQKLMLLSEEVNESICYSHHYCLSQINTLLRETAKHVNL